LTRVAAVETEMEEKFQDVVQSPQPSPYPTSKRSAALDTLVLYTPQCPKPKRKSTSNVQDHEDVVVVGDALQKLMASPNATATKTTINKQRQSRRVLISNVQDPKLPWG